MSTRTPVIHAYFYNDPDTYPPIVNGARLLAQAGYQMSLFARLAPARWSVSYPAEVKVHRLDGQGRGSWREYAHYLRKMILSGQPKADLYFGHDMHGFLPARLLATIHRRPLVYQAHEISVGHGGLSLGSKLARAFEHRFARTADLFIIPDADRGRVMKEALRLREDPLVVANAPLARPAPGSNKLREALVSMNAHPERIVYRQGRVGPGHAIEPTIRSMPLWNSHKWAFAVMGMVDAPYKEHLYSLADSLGVKDRFHILPPVSYDQVAYFTPGADVGHGLYEPIIATNIHYTTSSNKIMEYMAASLPLLLCDNPSLRSLVNKYSCGVTVDEGSPESIASGINELLDSPSKAVAMGEAGARAFDEVFSYKRQFSPVVQAINSLVKE